MKLQHKTAGLMILTGSLALLLVTVISAGISKKTSSRVSMKV